MSTRSGKPNDAAELYTAMVQTFVDSKFSDFLDVFDAAANKRPPGDGAASATSS